MHQPIIVLQNYLHDLSLNVCIQEDLQELLFSMQDPHLQRLTKESWQ